MGSIRLIVMGIMHRGDFGYWNARRAWQKSIYIVKAKQAQRKGMTVEQTAHTAVIMAAGEYYAEPIVRHEGDVLIAADGGLDHARGFGLEPDYCVGDRDSSTARALADTTHMVVLPPEKDDPDLLSALKFAWSQGLRTFHIYGALGGRIDHTISALQTVALVAEHGGAAILHGDGQMVTAICDGMLKFSPWHAPEGRGEAPYVSVFAHSDVARGINETGLKYGLDDATMHNTNVNGLSNEFVDGQAAAIDVHDGTLIVTYPLGAATPQRELYREFTGDLGELSFEVTSALRVSAR
ncbi:thiamine diphosphokinase [Bifidobacterium gallicum DSM 20093 = LMG 11596]|uniref:Thiamine diphosphokinase n=3 Tax=Bifidobacterium gallicum TaxID=78342 RepID=D1NSZ2_9BIFI|nr:thiamine diphosphokinase [Bifidobacterium gallicum DSM 20093 = LMG 11596]